jgi:predicted RNA-binding Zn ribbon-like protein
VDLASYADLAVRLVNTQTPEGDRLGDLDALRELLTTGPHLSGRVGKPDLEAMVQLRADLRSIFESVSTGDEDSAAEGLNSLLLQHPVHPQISAHDGQRWHLHYAPPDADVVDRVRSTTAFALAMLVSEYGTDRHGRCAAVGCARVFADTSRNAARRYCSPACANRSAVAAHRARRRDAGAPVA